VGAAFVAGVELSIALIGEGVGVDVGMSRRLVGVLNEVATVIGVAAGVDAGIS
jgi:hypothetical protein